jgi:ABC-type multidrug transport system permease subunit
MFKLLRWAFLLLVLASIIGLAFLLGLSFGLGNNQAKFISETVPVLSMLGGWVSGIGALAAVLTTLWLADKQRREDVEKFTSHDKHVAHSP